MSFLRFWIHYQSITTLLTPSNAMAVLTNKYSANHKNCHLLFCGSATPQVDPSLSTSFEIKVIELIAWLLITDSCYCWKFNPTLLRGCWIFDYNLALDEFILSSWESETPRKSTNGLSHFHILGVILTSCTCRVKSVKKGLFSQGVVYQ